MKKFSKITNVKVNEQKPVESITTELDLMKAGVKKLMDSYLNVQMYGPVTRHERAGSVKVVGKELFLEALIDFLEEFTSKDKVKVLESLKSESKDWKLIDSKIDEIKESSNQIKESKLVSHKEKVKSMIQRFNTKESLTDYLNTTLPKVKNGELAYMRSLAAKRMMKENKNPLLKIVEESYSSKYKELGFTL
jgi:hypothetical protein